MILVHGILEKIFVSDFDPVHRTWKMLPLYLVKYRSQKIFLLSSKQWMRLKKSILPDTATYISDEKHCSNF